MKKILSFFLCALMLIPTVGTMLSVSASYYDASGEYNGLLWSYEDATHTLTISGTGAMPNGASQSDSEYFALSSKITKVVVEEGITEITDKGFYGMKKMKSISLPGTLKTIGNMAFAECTALKSVEIPDSVTSIGGGVFSGCTSLTSAGIPAGVTSMGDEVFVGCTKLKTASFANEMAVMPRGTFRDCTSLTLVVFPKGVTDIGVYCLSGCTAYEALFLPSTVTHFSANAVKNCTALKEITMTANVKEIVHTEYFKTCTALEELEYYGTCEQWVELCGSYNDKYYVPASDLQNIAVHFSYETSYPTNDTEIVNQGTLSGGQQWTLGNGGTYTVSGTGEIEDAEGLDDFFGDDALLRKTAASVVISEGITGIGYASLCGMSCNKVEIADSVTTIEKWAFRSCGNLRFVVIGSGIKTIEAEAFSECSNLVTIFYNGTREQWNAVSKDGALDEDCYAAVCCLKDGPIIFFGDDEEEDTPDAGVADCRMAYAVLLSLSALAVLVLKKKQIA